MKLREIAEKLRLRMLTPELEPRMSREVAKGHASDLLSDVLANAPPGGLRRAELRPRSTTRSGKNTTTNPEKRQEQQEPKPEQKGTLLMRYEWGHF